MKVLKVIDTLAVGGAEKVFVDLTNLLHENNVNVTALFLLESGILSDQINTDIEQIELKRRFKWSIFKMSRCAKIMRNYEIIHCHHRYVFSYINICAKIFNVNSKIILHDHYGLIDIDQNIPFNISCTLKPRFYIGVSKKLTNWANDKLKVKSTNIFLLPNIVRKCELEKQSSKTFDWILVGNIKKTKNQIFAIKLATAMEKSLLIVGNVQDEEYYTELQNQIRTSKSMVKIISNVKNTRSLMQQANLGMHVSKSETGPLVLIEYLSVGLPFISFDTGEVVQSLKSEFPEMVMSNFNLENWIAAIKQLSKNDNQKYREKILEYYSTNFSENKYAKTCIKIYESISQNY